jgi:hypothetical protein
MWFPIEHDLRPTVFADRNPEVAEKFERSTLNPGGHAGARINHDQEETKSNHCRDLYARGN